jgi:hypothetical protein
MGARESKGRVIRAERYQGLRSFHLCRVGVRKGLTQGPTIAAMPSGLWVGAGQTVRYLPAYP